MATNPAPWYASLHQASSVWSCLVPGSVQLLPRYHSCIPSRSELPV